MVQGESLVPILDLEIVCNGPRSIDVARKTLEKAFYQLFWALEMYGVLLDATILKINMVVNGHSGPKARR
eukprot:3786576-Alexandrium_andersonii.AAC.1